MQKSKLILGTVQFGLKYGINNHMDKPNGTEVQEILEFAYANNIDVLDTADAYGNASELIGEFHTVRNDKFNVITKFKNTGETFSIENWLALTLNRLNVPSLFACMFHSIDDYFNNPKLLNDLISFYQKGLIKNIGVSIYTNIQFEKVIDDPSVHLIQLPYNLLDNTNYRGELIQKAKAKEKIIHIRSVFLQGLFFMDPNNLPLKLQSLKPELSMLQDLSNEYNIPMQSLALNYVAANDHIDGIIIGIDNLKQLKDNIDSLTVEIPKELICHIDSISTKHLELLNPVNWS